jgi:hypothetical protein
MPIKMDKKFSLILGALLLGGLLKAQSFQNYFADTIQRINIETQASYFYGSNGVSNKFLNHFITGGRIEKEDKLEAYKNLKSTNIFGADLNFSLNAEIPFDTLFGKSNMSLILGVEMVEHADIKFTDDLFKLAFDGNKQFAGTSAQLGGTNIHYFNYQQFNIGYIKYKKQHGKVARESVKFSIIKAQEHIAITVPRGQFFTEQFGRDIALDVNYIYNSSDTLNKGLSAFNGYGVSTDLFSEFYLKNKDKITVQVNDLGFIQWNKKSIQIEADTIFNYDGIDIENVFDLNDSLVSDISSDSLLNLISTDKSKGGYSIALPTSINVFYTKQFNAKIKVDLGAQYKILANYVPLVYTNIYYYFNPSFVAQTHFSYGGYGLFNTGLVVAKSFKNKYQCYLGSNNVLAYFIPKSTYSSSTFVGLKMYF